MSSLSPLLTIAIPFYNPGEYIINTLQSVYQQSYQNIELIVYNDGSTDESYRLTSEWMANNKERFANCSIVNEAVNKGVGYACDVLFKKSTGLYFQMLGADDVIYPDKIARQVDLLQANDQYAMVYGNMDRIDKQGNKLGNDYFTHQQFSSFNKSIPPSGSIFAELIQENFIPASSVLVKKSAIENVGGYDATLKSEDWDLWLRIAKKYKVLGDSAVVGGYRILPGSAMHSSKNKIYVLESLNEALVKHKGMSEQIDAVINDHLYIHTMEMYRLGYISKKWSGRLYTYQAGIKPKVYHVLMALGIKVNQKR